MSELPELDDAAFKLATGEELVLPGDAPAPAAAAAPASRRTASSESVQPRARAAPKPARVPSAWPRRAPPRVVQSPRAQTPSTLVAPMRARVIHHLRVLERRDGRWQIVSHLISQAKEKGSR